MSKNGVLRDSDTTCGVLLAWLRATARRILLLWNSLQAHRAHHSSYEMARSGQMVCYSRRRLGHNAKAWGSVARATPSTDYMCLNCTKLLLDFCGDTVFSRRLLRRSRTTYSYSLFKWFDKTSTYIGSIAGGVYSPRFCLRCRVFVTKPPAGAAHVLKLPRIVRKKASHLNYRSH